MISAIRKRVTYANVAVTVALVFAMAGGAIAAGSGKHNAGAVKHKPGYVITSINQIRPGVRKALTGKVGPQGEKGAPGAPGTAGAEGKEGKAGKDGLLGSEGKEGKAGEGVTLASLGAGEGGCAEGGTEVSNAASKAAICSGAEGSPGSPGKEGEPWKVGGLPKGATETGGWMAPQIETATVENYSHSAVSFNVPLKANMEPSHVIVIKTTESKIAHCPGTAEVPKAEEGYLCIYAGFEGKALGYSAFNLGGGSGVGTTGFGMSVYFENPQEFAYGTWAVTGT